MTGLLSVRDVSVQFGGIKALDGVSIEVDEASCCGIFGPNGSGKTTLLGVISRLTPLRSGSLSLGGHDFTRSRASEAARLGIARTFQTVRLLPMFDVKKNVMLGAVPSVAGRGPLGHLLALPRLVHDERVVGRAAEAALERVGMREHQAERPQDLPYGLQRRVEIARALVGSPRVLLLDEPVAGMNHAERMSIADLMGDLRAAGITQLLIEHDLELIHRVCDKAYALDFGRVVASGPPRQVAQEQAVREAYLGVEAAATQGAS